MMPRLVRMSLSGNQAIFCGVLRRVVWEVLRSHRGKYGVASNDNQHPHQDRRSHNDMTDGDGALFFVTILLTMKDASVGIERTGVEKK